MNNLEIRKLREKEKRLKRKIASNNGEHGGGRRGNISGNISVKLLLYEGDVFEGNSQIEIEN